MRNKDIQSHFAQYSAIISFRTVLLKNKAYNKEIGINQHN
jgi:hypothetical protein